MILVTAQVQCDGCLCLCESVTKLRPQNASMAVDKALALAASRGWAWPLTVDGTRICVDRNLYPACQKEVK